MDFREFIFRYCLKIRDKFCCGLPQVVKTKPQAPFATLSVIAHERSRALQRFFQTVSLCTSVNKASMDVSSFTRWHHGDA